MSLNLINYRFFYKEFSIISLDINLSIESGAHLEQE